MNTIGFNVFRNPELGKVKTRLAQAIGDKKALSIYNKLLLHTMQTTEKLACDLFVFYDTTINDDDIWKNTVYNKKIQVGNNLGERMKNAFHELFNLGYKNCIIIGSDLFDLQAKHIEEAFDKLEKKDVVIGPAEDGGYYLLGLKKMLPTLFLNKKWGTKTVLEDTLKDLSTFSIDFTATLNDIDTIEDLEKSNHYKQKHHEK